MVPNGWEHKAFGEVVKLSKSKYDPKKSTDCFPCIELEHIAQETGQLTGNVPASNLGSTKNKFKAGDVIFGKLRPYLRKYAQPNFDGVCSSEIWVFSPTKKIINPYLFQLVQTNQFISEANKSAGSKMPRADWGVVSEMVFPLPPLPEQRKIAKILSTWDKAISTTERLIDNSKQQKKALMQQLLTGKKRLLDDSGKPFEGEWEDLYLHDVAKIIVSPVDKKIVDGEIPVELCNYTDVYYNTRIINSIEFMKATAKKSEIDKYTLQVNDVIITKDSETPGDIAVPALVSEDLGGTVCGYHLAIVRPNSQLVEGAYLNYLFSMQKTRYYFFTLATGATRFGLSIGGINKAHFTLPPLEEQRRIAAVLTNSDREVELLEQQLADLKQEKKALMQQLLTGKRRVKVDEEAMA